MLLHFRIFSTISTWERPASVNSEPRAYVPSDMVTFVTGIKLSRFRGFALARTTFPPKFVSSKRFFRVRIEAACIGFAGSNPKQITVLELRNCGNVLMPVPDEKSASTADGRVVLMPKQSRTMFSLTTEAGAIPPVYACPPGEVFAILLPG